MAGSSEKAVMVLAIDEHEHSSYALGWTLDRFFTPFGSDAPFKLVLVNAKSSPPVAVSMAGPGALGTEFFPTVEVQLKQLADQITEKARQICASKLVLLFSLFRMCTWFIKYYLLGEGKVPF
ncbi:unnamed protein product [Lupinus luteus]|uniref:Universal stress protein n=1 Tax=Lupinus luteus TaxID=3873 RepID=A0AAV1YAW2_LUPLU